MFGSDGNSSSSLPAWSYFDRPTHNIAGVPLAIAQVPQAATFGSSTSSSDVCCNLQLN